MKMSRKQKKRRREKRKKLRRMYITGILLAFAGMLLFAGGYAYAKYLKESARKGIALASSVWFTSNHAFSVTENADTDDMSGVMKSQEASTDADGKNYDFTVEIRNYKNILVFNKSSEAIPYTISFRLSGTPASGDSYQVKPVFTDRAADGTITETSGTSMEITESWTEFTHAEGIPGGEALEDKYRISISRTGGNPVSVYVMARTADDAVITETLKGEIELVRGGGSGEFLQSAGFLTGTDSVEDSEQVISMKEQSAFTYRIVTGGAEENVDELTLYWDPQVYVIDRFSNAYITWSEDHTDEAPDSEWGAVHDAPGSTQKSNIPIAAGEEEWHADWSAEVHYITIPANSYASVSIGFFRGSGYVEADMDSMDMFHKYIHLEKGTP